MLQKLNFSKKLKLWWFALYRAVKVETERLTQEATGQQSMEQEKTKVDLTRNKIVRDYLKKEMEYVRLLKSFEKVPEWISSV